jgi:hypothetical protein
MEGTANGDWLCSNIFVVALTISETEIWGPTPKKQIQNE